MISDLSNIRLALHYHIEARVENGNVFYPSYYGKWIDSLAPYFKEIVLLTHTTTQKKETQYQIEAKNISVVDLGPKPPFFLKRVMKYRHYQRLVAKEKHLWDAVGFRVPSPLAIFLYPVMKEKAAFFLLVGNMINATRMSRMAWWKKRLLINYWRWDHWKLARVANQGTVFANGPSFLEEFPKIRNQVVIFNSTIWQKEIADREDCCTGKKVELLYVGRFSPEKGLDTALEAVKLLRAKGCQCRFRLAGTTGGEEYKRLQRIIRENNLNNMVEFLGFVAQGAQMNSLLDSSDIFVIPSRWDWQTRALWEGMARGLPVIASRGIKSLPMVFEHKKEIYFVDPEQPDQIANAVIEIKRDKILREILIQSSLKIAKERTLEHAAQLLVSGLKKGQRGNS